MKSCTSHRYIQSSTAAVWLPDYVRLNIHTNTQNIIKKNRNIVHLNKSTRWRGLSPRRYCAVTSYTRKSIYNITHGVCIILCAFVLLARVLFLSERRRRCTMRAHVNCVRGWTIDAYQNSVKEESRSLWTSSRLRRNAYNILCTYYEWRYAGLE